MFDNKFPLVSIITPCFNGELYVQSLLDSILNQTYSNIELLFVNDGSIDNTEQIVLSYKDKIESKGYLFKYLYQENAGQSAAINLALPLFHGDYLMWVDSDDYFSDDAVEKKVSFMECHKELGLCICKTQVIDFVTGKTLGELSRKIPKCNDNLFNDLILGTNVYYAPGGYMVRSEMFRKVMPSMKIETPKEIGQNYQLLLPISYKYPYGYIDEVLYFYRVRQNSHSHTIKKYEECKHITLNVTFNLLSNIADSLEDNEEKLSKIKQIIQIKKYRNLLNLLYEYKRKDDVSSIIDNLKALDAYDDNSKKLALLVEYPILRIFQRLKIFK